MDLYYIIYHSLITIALILSFIAYIKGSKKSLYLVLVLLATFLVELFASLQKIGFDWIYHLFNPIEYTAFCIYYLKTCPIEKYKTPVAFSIPVFIVFGLCVSFFKYKFSSMPAVNIDVEGFLLFIIYAHLLFSINVDVKMFIYSHPDFWISIGVLIFFGGVFIFFGLYPKLYHLDLNSTLELFGKIAKPLNLILYNCIIIGFVCLLRHRKYLIQ